MNTLLIQPDSLTPTPAPTSNTSDTRPALPIDIQGDRRPTMVQLIRIELRKLRDTRSGAAMMTTMLALGFGIPLIMLIVVADSLGFANYMLGAEALTRLLLPAVIINLVTSEWSQRAAMTTFTLVPGRARVLTAKFGAALTATVMLYGFIVAVAAAMTLVEGAFASGPTQWDLSWSDIGLDGLTFVWTTLFAFALATLALNTATGLVSFYIISIGLPPILNMGLLVKGLGSVIPWISPDAPNEVYLDPTNGASWAHLATATLLWVGIPLAIGIRRVMTTEIK